MLEIRTDISSLSVKQRETLAGFIMTFDGDEAEGRPAPSLALVPKAPITVTGVQLGEIRITTDPESPNPSDVFAIAGANIPPPPPAATLSVTLGEVILDKANLPWDARIHASAKTFTAEGFWRKKRGAEDALVAEVEAELKALTPARVAAIPPPPSADLKGDYVKLMTRASAAMHGGKITQAELGDICKANEIAAFPLLAQHLDKVAKVGAEIDALIASRA